LDEIKDPEVKEILHDPVFMKLLKTLQTNPRDPRCFEMLKDPEVKRKMCLLEKAGVINMSSKN
jgi:hypothetical protein